MEIIVLIITMVLCIVSIVTLSFKVRKLEIKLKETNNLIDNHVFEEISRAQVRKKIREYEDSIIP